MMFQRAKPKDLDSVTEMGMFLWPNDRKDQVGKAMRTSLSSPEHAVIICKAESPQRNPCDYLVPGQWHSGSAQAQEKVVAKSIDTGFWTVI